MGQKSNPKIYRTSNKNYLTKNKYFEKNIEEKSLYVHNNEKIKKYIKDFFSIYKIITNIISINAKDSFLNIFVSFFITKESLKELPKIKFSEYYKKKYIIYKKKPLPIKRFNRIKKLDKLKTCKLGSITEQIIKSLKNFLNQKHIKITFQVLNKGLSFYIKKKNFKQLKTWFIKLRKYRRQFFYNNTINILLLAFLKKNTTELLCRYLCLVLGRINRQTYYVKFLKQCLKFLFSRKIRKIKGIKIQIKGVLNNKNRKKKITIKYGSIPLQTQNTSINYSHFNGISKRGVIGTKVWIHEKI